jgi:hypothetical protein
MAQLKKEADLANERQWGKETHWQYEKGRWQ